MSLPTRVGVSLPIPAASMQTNIDIAVWAEKVGVPDVWIADVGGHDALVLATAIAAATSRLRIGTAVIPAFTRTPAVFASTLMSLSHLAEDRFVLGLGSSSHAMIENWHGLPFEKPLTRVRETTEALRSMLNGEKSNYQGATLHSRGYALYPAPKGKLPIYLAGLRPGMLEMAGEVGDGVILNLPPLSAVPKIIEHIETGAKRAGKKIEDVEIVCRFWCGVTDDPLGAIAEVRKILIGYFATPVYNKFLAWCGYGDVASELSEAFHSGDRERTQKALGDEFLDSLLVMGDEEKCQARIREYIAAGITTPMIHAVVEDVQRTYNAFTAEGFPVG